MRLREAWRAIWFLLCDEIQYRRAERAAVRDCSRVRLVLTTGEGIDAPGNPADYRRGRTLRADTIPGRPELAGYRVSSLSAGWRNGIAYAIARADD